MASASKYVLEEREYPIEVIRKNNKNTYLRVKDETIVITTNYFTTSYQIKKLIEDNKIFINRLLKKNEEKKKDTTFKLFGQAYDVIYGFPKSEIEENKIYCKDIKAFNKFLSKYLYDIYKERLDHYYYLFEEKIPYPNLKIRKITSRWGVCNLKNNNVTLNLELSKYDIKCLDYVIVHELSHFIYPNHSKDFWLLVSKYYPNYKEIRKSLRN